ncbi:MAG: acylphosphatase [Anaerolineae bacterium]
MARLEARVRGRVQGVFYRDQTRTRARQLGLTGYVRNLPDGTVEAVADGPPDALEKLLEWLRVGSSSAQVEGVEVRWGTSTGEFSRFEVRF